MKRLALALILVSTLPFAVAAKDTFKNLPGVKDPAKEEAVQLDTVCTSQLERTWPSRFPARNGLAERTYGCDEGQLSSGSNRPPNLIEYRKLKQYYRSN